MTISKLKEKIAVSNLPNDICFFMKHEGFPNEAFCFVEKDNKYEVYYSERGCKRGLAEFTTEDEACEHLAMLLGIMCILYK